MTEPIVTSRPPTAAPPLLPSPANGASAQPLASRGLEVSGNWVIDRDFGLVRRRYWGKVPVEGIEFPEA